MSIDREMSDILGKSDISEDVKIQLYYQTLQKFMDTEKRYDTNRNLDNSIVSHPVKDNHESSADTEKSDSKNWESIIRSALPKNQQNKGVKIYKWINENMPEIKINDSGERGLR